jgi:hypothetical protein
VVIVVGEMTGVPTGLGAMIMEARQLSRTEIVIGERFRDVADVEDRDRRLRHGTGSRTAGGGRRG